VNIAGATLSSYTTPATTTSDSGSTFAVVVTNTAGTVTSSTATLAVNPAPVAPTITTQPGSQTVTAGQTATFAVVASGTAPLSYQWRKNGVAISGATSSNYTTPATTTSDSGSTFAVVVTNTAGDGDEFDGDVDGEPGTGVTDDHHAAREPDGDRGTDGDVRGGGEWNSTAELPVAEERREHRRGHGRELHHASDYDIGQWINVRSGRQQHGGDGDKFGGDADGEPGAGVTDNHHAAREPDGDCGTDSDVHGGGGRDSTTQLSVAEERREHRRSHGRELPPRRQLRLRIVDRLSPWR